MKKAIELSLPTVAMFLIAAWSSPAMVAVIAWTAVGMVVFKAAGLRIRLSDDNLSAAWKHGWRKGALVMHRYWYWPYYLLVQRIEHR